tara:strand:- start:1893 stop:2093 length:201 start_codon:yes stop_codon:yes gene_type:complete
MNEFETLQKNINYWTAIVQKQEKRIGQDVLFFPISWNDYLHAKRQLERVKRKYGTTEMWEIKDLHR